MTALLIFAITFISSQRLAYLDIDPTSNLTQNLLLLIFYSGSSFVAYHILVRVIGQLIDQRNFFESGHIQFVHSLDQGIVIIRDHFRKIALINVTARQILKLPFAE